MTWLTPLLAGIAAAIAIPSLVILYFLKLRRKTVDVSTTLLWKKAIQDLQANAPFQRLRKNILLLLQLLALIAALFAIAQPQTEVTSSLPSRHVLLIDRSASMAATDGDTAATELGTTRLSQAKLDAKDFINNMKEASALGIGAASEAEEAMVIAFDAGSAEVLQTFTGDKRLLQQAIDRIEQTDAASAVTEAYRLAQAHRPRETRTDDAGGSSDAEVIELEGLVGGPPQTFHLFTDGRLPDADAFLPAAGDSVVYHRAGRDAVGNIAITGLRAERAYDEPAKLSVFVGIQNTSETAASVDVELMLDGQIAALKEIQLSAAVAKEGVVEQAVSEDDEDGEAAAKRAAIEPGSGGVVFELERQQGAIATIRVRTDRAPDLANVLPTDDEGVLVIPAARRTAAALFTSGNPFIEEAMNGLPLSRFDVFAPSVLSEILADPERRAQYDVLVIDGFLPLEETPEGRPLPPGRWLVLNAIPGGQDGLIRTGSSELTRFLDWSRTHPVLRSVSLDPVRIASLIKTEVPETGSARVIAETPEGPGLVEIASGDVRALVVPFDVINSTWPFDVSFVVTVARAIDILGREAGATGGEDARRLTPGGVLTDRLPAGIETARITAPDERRVDLAPAPDGRITFGPVKRRGVYEINWAGPAAAGDTADGDKVTRFYAANLLDAEESDVRPQDAVELASKIVQAAGTGESATVRRYWRWLLIATLGVIMFEWWVFNKKVYL